MTNPSALNAVNNPRGGRFWIIIILLVLAAGGAGVYLWSKLYTSPSRTTEWKPKAMDAAANKAYADRKLAMRSCDFRHPGSVQKLQGNILRERPFFEQAAKPADDEYAYKRCYYKAQALQQLDNLGYAATVARATAEAPTVANDEPTDTAVVPNMGSSKAAAKAPGKHRRVASNGKMFFPDTAALPSDVLCGKYKKLGWKCQR